MATSETISLNDPHPPGPRAIEAFGRVLPAIKAAILQSRKTYAQPEMWKRVNHLDNAELTDFDIDVNKQPEESDLVLIRSAATSYGTVILGKIRIPRIENGYIHVRIHDPPNRGNEDVIFHSIFTDEGNKDADGRPTTWHAIQTLNTPLEFFHE